MTKSKQMQQLELYFHIPFCLKKCNYCDFLSFPCEDTIKSDYMEALIRETKQRAAEYNGYEVVSLFVGGGTPSVANDSQIVKLMETAYSFYHVAETAEVTIEVNPGTVSLQKLKNYRKAGINRLSIGLQSAHNRELKLMGRIHTWEQFLDTYQWAREADFENINVDVMSALPDQTLSAYRQTLEMVLQLCPPPEHISAYSLIVEEGTEFAKRACSGALCLPDEDCERQMYADTKDMLENCGYQRYEISNYAKKGYECRHNCGYWRRVQYLGMGLGAASLIGNRRFQNGNSLQEYLENPLNCRTGIQELSAEEQMEEFMFLGLRLTKGVSRKEFFQCFDVPMETVYGKVLEQGKKDGLLTEEKEWVRLTDRGLDLSNYVMAQFLLES